MFRPSILLLSFLSLSVCAKGLSPYLPLKVSPEVEAKIEKLMALTPAAPLTRPYKASDLKARLTLIKDAYPILHSQLNSYLDRFVQPFALTHASLSASVANDSKRALPNRRNVTTDSRFQGSLGGLAYLSPYAYVSSGVMYDDEVGLLHYNSHLAVGFDYLQLELGYREHWFSPFQDSAMLLSSHAQASPSVTLSNSKPITSWNIRYELFYSMLERVDRIVLGDRTFPGKPKHAGFHLSFTPLDFWTLGFNRTLQFGGGQREVSVGDFFQALFDPAGKDNVGDVVTDDINFEFGNQQASVTSKWNFHWGLPISVYAEYAGEDTVSESNFQLGNKAVSVGLYLPRVTSDIALRYEYSDIASRWYVHHIYLDGYTNEGQVMGHWAGGERVFNQDTPVTAHALNMNWQLAHNQLLNLDLRVIDNQDTPNTRYQTGYELDATYSFANRYGFWGLQVYAGKDVFGDNFTRLTGFYRW